MLGCGSCAGRLMAQNWPMNETIQTLLAPRSELDEGNPADQRTAARMAVLEKATMDIVAAAAADGTGAYWVADDYLRAVAVLLLDWAWLKIAREAPDHSARWAAPAQALQRWVMPEFGMRIAIISAPAVALTA